MSPTETPGLRERVVRFFTRDLWRGESEAAPGWPRRVLQFFVVVVEEFRRDELLLRASALTYYTILSLIPLLAIALSLVEALGVREDLAAVIVERVAGGSPEAARQILALLERVDFSGLGTIGAATLVLTSILGISSIERALNGIWGIRRSRPWERRVPDYLAVLIVAPLLLGVALSLGTTLESQWLVQRLLEVPGFAALYRLGLRQAPTFFLWFGFSFLYWFLPNTRVRVTSALLGGAVAAVLFTVAQQAYLGFSVGVARYNALFGGLAALPLLLIWIYVSWVIVLFGAEISFTHQHLAYFRRVRHWDDPNPATREALALDMAVRIAQAFEAGEGGVDADTLADEVEAPVRTVRQLLGALEQAGIVSVRGGGDRERFQLGRPAARIRALDVLHAVRGALDSERLEHSPARAVLARLARCTEETAGAVTLADLVVQAEADERGSGI